MCQDAKMKIQSQVYFLVALGVVSTDAWFWSWTGTTTLAPTSAVEHEGSGSPAGSGDSPPESFAKLGAEINDEGLGFQNIVQTWNETTVAPVLTTTIKMQNENGSETEPAEISSPISKPGNGMSLFMSFGSGTGNVSKLKPEFESGLALGTKSDVWSRLRSESGFGSEYEMNWESGIETVVSSQKEQQEGLVSDDYRLVNVGRVMSQEDELKLKSQSTYRITHTRKDHSSSRETATASNNTQENVNHNTSSTWNTVNFNLTFLQENSSRGDALLTFKSNNSGDTKQLIRSTQAANISQPAPVQEVSHNQIPLPTTLKTIISYLQTAHKKTDDSSIAKVYPLALGQLSATTHRVTTSPNDHSQTKATTLNQIAEGSLEQGESQKCLLLDIALPFCSSMTGQRFLMPNYLNHSTVVQVQALLHDWAWLLKSHCHHSLEWFFCLLLVPKCGSPVPLLPCRSFCEVLKDSCWTLLDEGRLPVECHALPDEEDDGYQCLSVSNQKGKLWLKLIPILAFIFNQFSNHSSPIVWFYHHFPLIKPPSRPTSALHSINKVLVPTLKKTIY